jgi:hypothetical protein
MATKTVKRKPTPRAKSSAKKTPLLLRPLKHLRSRGFVKLPSNRKKWMMPVAFAVIFGLIGCYFLFKSFAAEAPLTGANGEFVALSPARILDTRSGEGGYRTQLGANKTIPVQIAGRGGIPATNVKAVVLNVTVTAPTSTSYLTIWPSGIAKPNSSNVNFATGQTVANQVTVPVGPDGKVQIFNAAGSTHVIFDVAGFYQDTEGTSSVSTRFVSLSPTRILDTRTGEGGHNQPVAPDKSITVKVRGAGGLPDTATSVVLNLTVSSPTSGGYATVWPSGESRPNSSVINFAAGQTIANQVTVPIGSDGNIQIYNATGNSHFIFDVSGYFEPVKEAYEQTQDGRFVPLSPNRILDTRTGVGGVSQPLGQGQTVWPMIAGQGGVSASNVRAVVLNVTVTNAKSSTTSWGTQSGPSWLTIWPNGQARPNSSAINFVVGQTIANQITVPVSEDGKIQIYNAFGSVDVILDVAGYYLETYESNIQASGYVVVPYAELGSNMDSITKVQHDINIHARPTSEAFLQVGDFMYDFSRNELGFTCWAPQTCRVPNSVNAYIYEISQYYDISYNLKANVAYTYTEETAIDRPGYSGKWKFMSITDRSTGKTDLLAAYTDPQNYYWQSAVYSFFSVNVPSCKSTNQLSFSLSNFSVNDKFIDKSKVATGMANNEPLCPGMVAVSSDPSVSATSRKLTGTAGVPVSQRNVVKPVIQSVVQNGSKVTVRATDNLALVHLYSGINEKTICPIEAPNCEFTAFAGDVTLTYDFSSYPRGTYPLHSVAVDSTGLWVEKTTNITIN